MIKPKQSSKELDHTYTCERCDHSFSSKTDVTQCPMCQWEKIYVNGPSFHRCKDCCDCQTCLQADFPCHGDCHPDELCDACLLAFEEKAEMQFEIDRAQGKV